MRRLFPIIMEILIEGMEFHAFHGLYPEENRIGTKYTVDLKLTVDDNCGADDNIDSTVNYEQVYKIVDREMRHNSKLIEHLAHRILNVIHADLPFILHSEITLYKYKVPLGGKLNRVGVKLKR